MNLDRILDTSKEKVTRELVHQLKLEFSYVPRKMENVIRSTITPIVLPQFFSPCTNRIEIYMRKL